MKLNLKLLFSFVALFVPSTQCSEFKIKQGSEIIVRLATEKDLPVILNLTHTCYETDFKPLWQKHYPSLTPGPQTIDEIIKIKENQNENAIKNFINQQKQNEKYCVIVAYMIEPTPYVQVTQNEFFTGYCRFKKEDRTTMYINHILIDPLFRKKGIAKILIGTAIGMWNIVEKCTFQAFIHHDLINTLQKKYDCEITKTIALNPTTGKKNGDPSAPKTHNEYIYTINRTLPQQKQDHLRFVKISTSKKT